MGTTQSNTIIHFKSEDITLEGMLSLPSTAVPVPGAVVCHPHPQFGGDMDNNVVLAVSAALEQLDMAVLRFNFRGVNGSEGTFDNGNGETRDVVAALSLLAEHEAVERSGLFLVGYSFGAFVGLQAALHNDKVKAFAAISIPVDVYDFEFLSEITVPILLVCGDRDSFCSVNRFERTCSIINAEKEKIIFPGVDHFYWGREDAPAEAVQSFARKHCL